MILYELPEKATWDFTTVYIRAIRTTAKMGSE